MNNDRNITAELRPCELCSLQWLPDRLRTSGEYTLCVHCIEGLGCQDPHEITALRDRLNAGQEQITQMVRVVTEAEAERDALRAERDVAREAARRQQARAEHAEAVLEQHRPIVLEAFKWITSGSDYDLRDLRAAAEETYGAVPEQPVGEAWDFHDV